MNIAIVTDSTADIPQHLVDAHHIKVIPLTVHFGGKSYRDRVDITNEEFYSYIATAKTLPTTSQPSPAEFVDVYRACKAEGADKIISLHLSAELSGTVQGAKMAAEMVADEIEVAVFDSRSATVGMGLQVVSVAKAAEHVTEDEWPVLLERIPSIIEKTKIYFLLDTLDNLQKGGRIGKASYLVGSMLNIKPILVLEDGVISAYEKIRGKKLEKAVDHLSEVVLSKIDPAKPLHVVLAYNNKAYLTLLEQSFLPKLEQMHLEHCERLDSFEIGSVVTTHVGLGGFGIAFYQ